MLPVPQGKTPYIPRYRPEMQLAKRIAIARWAGFYGLIAFWGGIVLGAICAALLGGLVLGVQLQFSLLVLAALTVALLAIVTALALMTTSFLLHVISSLQAINVKRRFPHNPLPAKFLHAEFIRWFHRVDLVLTVAATIAATFSTLGFGAAVTIPSGIGLGFLGWAIATVWGLGANRIVYKEVARQRKLSQALWPRVRRTKKRSNPA
jgi:MFS family permease